MSESPETEDRRSRAADPYGDGLDELPPNIPPGFLGERVADIDLRKVDSGGPYGLNAGVIQEWTVQTTLMVVALTYIFFFPAAFVILWRSKRLTRRFKIDLSIVMGIGVVYFGGRLLGLF